MCDDTSLPFHLPIGMFEGELLHPVLQGVSTAKVFELMIKALSNKAADHEVFHVNGYTLSTTELNRLLPEHIAPTRCIHCRGLMRGRLSADPHEIYYCKFCGHVDTYSTLVMRAVTKSKRPLSEEEAVYVGV